MIELIELHSETDDIKFSFNGKGFDRFPICQFQIGLNRNSSISLRWCIQSMR